MLANLSASQANSQQTRFPGPNEQGDFAVSRLRGLFYPYKCKSNIFTDYLTILISFIKFVIVFTQCGVALPVCSLMQLPKRFPKPQNTWLDYHIRLQ